MRGGNPGRMLHRGSSLPLQPPEMRLDDDRLNRRAVLRPDLLRTTPANELGVSTAGAALDHAFGHSVLRCPRLSATHPQPIQIIYSGMSIPAARMSIYLAMRTEKGSWSVKICLAFAI